MNEKEPSMLFHVGDPREEKPHLNLSRCEKLFECHPGVKLVVVVWDEAAHAELTTAMAGKNCEVWMWADDGSLMNRLADNLAAAVGANIITISWYTCPDGHVTPSSGGRLKDVCETEGCGKAVSHHLPLKERLEEFSGLFEKVIRLSNFDTRSGEWLQAQVSPTANWGRNMRHALSGASTRALRRTGAGKPILCCAAGPSLEDAIPHIKRLNDRVLVSCVGRSYKLLRKHGIRVDYVITCEMFDWDAAIFDGLTEAEVGDAVLCYASVASPKAVDAWPGDKVCLFDMNTAAMYGRSDFIMGGNSVAHHQMNFAAQILGCDPIVLVGTDLAYTKGVGGGKTHADGTFHDGWPQAIKDAEVGDQAEFWGACTGKGDAFEPSAHRVSVWLQGGFSPVGPIMVRSSPAYRDFGTLFEILIARHGKKVYNACPNGLKIAGAEYLDLSTWMASTPTTLCQEGSPTAHLGLPSSQAVAGQPRAAPVEGRSLGAAETDTQATPT